MGGGGGGGAMRSKIRRRPKTRSKSKVHASGVDSSQQDLFSCRIPEWTAEQYAADALDCYHKARGIKEPLFQVVKGLGCSRVLGYISEELKKYGVRDFCHVSFYAKPTKANKIYKDTEEELLIFAELVDSGYCVFNLGDWWVSKPDDSDITYGCGFCPHEKKYPHCKVTRAEQFHTARCAYKPPDRTEQLLLAEAFKKQVMLLEGDKKVGRCQTIFEYDEYDPSSFTPDLTDDQYAELALKYVNTMEDVEFVLNEILGSTRRAALMMPDGFAHWCHVCFTATPKSDDENASPVTFFAELHAPREKEYCVNTYHKFVTASDERQLGCAFCQDDEKFPHPPTYTYKAGAFSRACEIFD
ncbi:hypothetical protein M5689_002248 [Euphorbia peplus]|nr:hypothetical protein M5689_002248 [Euphorbia peplus]